MIRGRRNGDSGKNGVGARECWNVSEKEKRETETMFFVCPRIGVPKGLNTTHQVLALLLWNTIAKDPEHIITFSEAHLKGGNGETEIEGPTGRKN